MTVVGLTGGIGTGKSTVAALLREMGAAVIDADQVSRAVVEKGSVGLQRIVDAFGPEVLDDQEGLDRAAMRRRIVSDPDAKATLEAITHPLIAQHIGGWLAARSAEGAAVAVVEAALMVETGSYRNYPHVWVVSANRATQVARVQQRDGVSRDDAEAIVASQWPMEKKEAVATRVLRNVSDLATLRAEVEAAWASLAPAVSRPTP